MHSRNIDGFNDPNGQAVLLEFRTMMSLNNFIKSFYENCTGVSLETHYDLQHIGVQISDNLKQEILQSLQRKRKSLHNKVYQTKKKIVDPTSIFWQNQEYSHNSDRILNDRKQYYVNNLDKIREKCRTYYAENTEPIRKKNQVYKSNNVKIIKQQKNISLKINIKYRKKQNEDYSENTDFGREKVKDYYEKNCPAVREKQARHFREKRFVVNEVRRKNCKKKKIRKPKP